MLPDLNRWFMTFLIAAVVGILVTTTATILIEDEKGNRWVHLILKPKDVGKSIVEDAFVPESLTTEVLSIILAGVFFGLAAIALIWIFQRLEEGRSWLVGRYRATPSPHKDD